ncbi:MAG: tol-pal system-associated acyl-CoA thioesterase [Burkholderiaceae bacterium]|jgi:acyl-CoA thioester hydrolase|nr:tol-pal system-associated acyl-CoA thioesterase [Burkholderiaceae bacterium]
MTAFEFQIRVYWEDTDAGGIVYYANYLKFFERARTEWLRRLGLGQQTLRQQTGGMFVVARAHIDYHRPAWLDDELVVTVQLQHRGRAALVVEQQARRARDAARQLLCQGTIRLGWVDAAGLKPMRIPPTIIEKLNP